MTTNILVECHGTKLRGDIIEIPNNVSIVSFSAENELSNATRTGIFKIFAIQDNTFVNKFTHILNIFGSDLINMMPLQLKSYCDDYNIKGYTIDDLKKILIVIRSGGRNKYGYQNITYFGPGTKISNYNLNYGFIEQWKQMVSLQNTPIIRGATKTSYNALISNFVPNVINTETSRLKIDFWDVWSNNKNYYMDLPDTFGLNVNVNYRMGVCNLDNNMVTEEIYDTLVSPTDPLKCKFKLSDIWKLSSDYIKKGHLTIFLNCCKRETIAPTVLQRIQPVKIQPLGLLQGVGLQLGFKSPRKSIKKSKKPKKPNKPKK